MSARLQFGEHWHKQAIIRKVSGQKKEGCSSANDFFFFPHTVNTHEPWFGSMKKRDLEQHGFELHSSTYMWIFSDKYAGKFF